MSSPKILTYKRKLILNKAQSERIRSWIGVGRLVYNMGLQIKTETYRAFGKSIGKYELMRQLPALKDIPWIQDVPAESLQISLTNLEQSFNLFFRNYKKGTGYPKYASKKNHRHISFNHIKTASNYVIIPKIGRLKIFKDATILGNPKSATITIEPSGFFISIYCSNCPKKINSDNQAIGLDMGISNFCVDSEGVKILNPQHFRKYEQKLKIENKSLSRKKKRSKSWIKQASKLRLLHNKISNVRKDFLHKESTKIAKRYSIVYMEDLNIKGMSKNTHISKHILDCGWGLFKSMLAYKTNVVSVNPKYTSQKCFECGHIDSKSRLSQDKFVCTSCGHSINADINAAKNIKSKGMALDR